VDRFRIAIADLVVGVVVILVALWLLRGVFRMVVWGANLVLIVLVVVLVLRLASKIRGQ
jgi:hypothetical protein